MGRGDPLIRDALQTLLDRGDFVPSLPDEGSGGPPAGGPPAPIETDPAIVAELIGRTQASIAALKRDIRTKSGSALLDFILADIQELKRILFDPQSHQVFMSAMEAAWWLNEQLQAWLGEKNAADTLRFEQGRQEAWKKEQGLLERLRALPDGERKAEEAKRMIDRVRAFIGYREYPKYGMVSRYFVYKQALLEEAERLVQAHVLREKEDIFYLTFQELHDVVRTNRVDDQLIRQRKDAFRSYQALTPPRVLTSDGEVIAGAYRRDDVPAGALVGLPVSAGTIEGRARVVLDIAEADLEAGDILVTVYTAPSWQPQL